MLLSRSGPSSLRPRGCRPLRLQPLQPLHPRRPRTLRLCAPSRNSKPSRRIPARVALMPRPTPCRLLQPGRCLQLTQRRGQWPQRLADAQPLCDQIARDEAIVGHRCAACPQSVRACSSHEARRVVAASGYRGGHLTHRPIGGPDGCHPRDATRRRPLASLTGPLLWPSRRRLFPDKGAGQCRTAEPTRWYPGQLCFSAHLILRGNRPGWADGADLSSEYI